MLSPVWDGYLADPFVLRHETAEGPEFYAVGTGSSVGADTTERRHFPLLFSRDLKNWEARGGALIPVAGLEKAPHWAPEICERDGTFYLYYSCECGPGSGDSTQRLRLATSRQPGGPYEDCGEMLLPAEGFTIDPSPFRDPQSGEWFLYFCRDRLDDERPGTGTAAVRLNSAMRASGEVSGTILPSGDWQIFERERPLHGRVFPAWHTVEGAHVVFRQGRYVCFYSGGAWTDESYGVSFATAAHPLGPWHDAGLERGACVLKSGDFGLRGPGHNAVVVGPDGRDYLVFHAWNAEATRRQMHIAPLAWDENGPRVDL